MLTQGLRVERERARQQLVQDHAQRVHIRARVDVQAAELSLFRTHVLGRADERANLSVERAFGQGLRCGLGDAKVDDFDDGRVVAHSDEDVRGFEIAVNDPFLVGMLHALTHLQKQFKAVGDRQSVPRGVRGNRLAADVLHGEVGAPLRRAARVEDPSDSRMVHEGQRLTLGFEPRHDLCSVHAHFDDLHGHLSANGQGLLGEPDLAHPALADALQQTIGSDGFGGRDMG